MKVILTEGQVREIIKEEVTAQSLLSQLSTVSDPNIIVNTLAGAIKTGTIKLTMIPSVIKSLFASRPDGEAQKKGILQRIFAMFKKEQEEQLPEGVWRNEFGTWKTVSDDTIATVYNAVPQQCNNDVVHTASMFKLNLKDVLSQKVIAMERTFMKELGVRYGDIVWVNGTGKWDGPWQIQDTMNKRFAGMHKIDLLVPRNIRTGKWNNVQISLPTDEKTALTAKNTMSGSA